VFFEIKKINDLLLTKDLRIGNCHERIYLIKKEMEARILIALILLLWGLRFDFNAWSIMKGPCLHCLAFLLST
jgi:hypothetical protein